MNNMFSSEIKLMLMSEDEQTFLLGLTCLTQCNLSEFDEKDFTRSPNVIVGITHTSFWERAAPTEFRIRSSIFHIKDEYRDNILFLEENKNILEKVINLKINIKYTQIFESYKKIIPSINFVTLTYL